MEFAQLLEIVGDEPLFDTGLLLAGNVNANHVRRQLSRWTETGRLYQLRRGLYALAPPFQKVRPHPFVVANRLVGASYVGLQSALAYHALIPEGVPVTTSVTTARPARWETPLGIFEFRHIKRELFFGYQMLDLQNSQEALVSIPEKALLDLIYLQPAGDSPEYVQELRLQNLHQLELDDLRVLAVRAGSSKLQRAVDVVAQLVQAETQEYETL